MSPYITDQSGRILALAADNEITQPAPRKFCAHGVLCRDCQGAK